MKIPKNLKNINVIFSLLLVLLGVIYINIAIQNSPEYFSSLGLMNYQKGNFKQALTAYNKSLKLNPDFFETYYNIGCVYFKLGDKVNSKKFFMKTLQMNKNYEPAKNNLKVIESP